MVSVLKPRPRHLAIAGGSFAVALAVILAPDIVGGTRWGVPGRPPAAVVTATITVTASPTTSASPSASPSPGPDSGERIPAPGGVVAAGRSGDGERTGTGGGGGAAPAPDPPAGGGGGGGPDSPAPPTGDTCPAGLVRAQATLGARVCLVVGARR